MIFCFYCCRMREYVLTHWMQFLVYVGRRRLVPVFDHLCLVQYTLRTRKMLIALFLRTASRKWYHPKLVTIKRWSHDSAFTCMFLISRVVMISLLAMLCDPNLALKLWMKQRCLGGRVAMSFRNTSSIWNMESGIYILCLSSTLVYLNIVSCSLSYAVYCLEKMRSTGSRLNVVLLYDIACMLEKHIKVSMGFTVASWFIADTL